MTDEKIEVDMKRVGIIVDVFTKTLMSLPAAGCDWTLADLSVANAYILHSCYEYQLKQGKIKKV